ncbi:oligosaccharide flippase family protein [Pseudoalteromonas sp. SS15]|uniref:oligosaccharide flippase family protein n=1 Tax=Pseudoalteromonas sp. SS15 TaxID=3139393 RepID=UPI003BADB93F
MSFEKKIALFYTFGALLNKAIPFLLLPFYTRVMTVEDFGIYGIFMSLFSLSAVFVGLKPNTYIVKELSSKTNRAKDTHYIIVACFIIIPLSAFVVSPFIFFITKLSFDNEFNHFFAFVCIVILSVLQALRVVVESVYQANNKVFKVLVLQISVTLISAIFVFITYFFVGISWEERVLAEVSAAVFVSLIMFYFFQFNFRRFRRKLLKLKVIDSAKFLTPLVWHSLSVVVLNLSDRLILNYYFGQQVVGKYIAAYTISMVCGVVFDAVIRAWSPYFFANAKKSKHSELIVFRGSIYLSLLALFLGALVAIVLSNIYSLILPDSYSGLSMLIIIISFAYSIEGVRKFFCCYLYLSNSTKFIASLSLFTAFCNLILNFIFVPTFSDVGAAATTLISFLFMTCVTMVFSLKKRKELLELEVS